MVPRADCLSEDELRAYVLGELGGEALDRAAAHIEACPGCEAHSARLDALADPLISRLRANVPAPGAQSTLATTRKPSLSSAGERAISPPGYEVLGVLGRGGMGVVYKARQTALGRLVALKMVVTGRLATPEERVRLRFEAELIARLSHPNIVGVLEAGEHDGLPFFALQFVGGGTLADALFARGPLPPREAAALVEKLARAMHHAHTQGVVHRDLKPANVLMEPDGTPKVGDFGLGRRHGESGGLTAVGAVMGTPAYMAPEQASGGRVGPAADVYALGAVLYECLAGRPPFTGATPSEVLARAQALDPTAPPGPRDLQTICLKCLAKAPEQRYASAEALADDLARYQADEPVKARPAGPLLLAIKWARRRPAVAALSAALLVLLVVSFVVLWWQRQEAVGLAGQREQQRKRAERLAAGLALEQGAALCQKGETGRGLLAFLRALHLADEAGDGPLERVARHNLSAWSAVHTRLRAHCPTANWCTSAVFSPDERHLLTGGKDGLAQLWRVADGSPVGAPLRHEGPVWSVAFGPPGTFVTGSEVPGGKGQVRVWRVGGGELLRKWGTPTGPVHVAFHPRDGGALLVVCDHDARVWSPETGEALGPLLTLSSAPSDETGLSSGGFSPDGQLVLLAGAVGPKGGKAGGEGRIWTRGGELRARLVGHQGAVQAAAFSPDGKRVATGAADGTARIWETESGRRVGAALGHTGDVTALAFSPDGSAVATANRVPHRDLLPGGRLALGGGQARLWDVESQQPLGAPLPHPRAVGALAFSPDGRLLMTGCVDGNARLFSTSSGEQVGARLPNAGTVRPVAFSRDGRLILTASRGNSARLWEAPQAGGPGGMLLSDRESRINRVAFSADGQSLLSGDIHGGARLWDVAARKVVARLECGGRIWDVAMRPGGEALLAGDFGLKAWAPKSGAVREAAAPGGRPVAVAISPGREKVFCLTARSAFCWEASSGRREGLALPAEGLEGPVVWGADRESVYASVQKGPVERRPLGGGRATRFDTGEAGGRPLAVSPDGQVVLTLDPGLTLVRRWRADGRQMGPPLWGDGYLIHAAAFSPDGALAVTAGEDGAARLWDVKTGHPVGPAWSLPQGGAACSLAFRPDGRQVAIGRSRLVQLVDVPAPVSGTAEEVDGQVRRLVGAGAEDGK